MFSPHCVNQFGLFYCWASQILQEMSKTIQFSLGSCCCLGTEQVATTSAVQFRPGFRLNNPPFVRLSSNGGKLQRFQQDSIHLYYVPKMEGSHRSMFPSIFFHYILHRKSIILLRALQFSYSVIYIRFYSFDMFRWHPFTLAAPDFMLNWARWRSLVSFLCLWCGSTGEFLGALGGEWVHFAGRDRRL